MITKPYPTGEFAVGTKTFTIYNTRKEVLDTKGESMRHVCARIYYPTLKENTNGLKKAISMSRNEAKGITKAFKIPLNYDKMEKNGENLSEAYVDAPFIEGMKGTVAQLYNHPCICYWTIFNEGWGQFEADKAYDLLRSLDDTRFIDATSGWFHQKKSDVDSLHIYFQKLRLGKQRELPQVLSEFGGYVYKFAKHSYNLNKTYGYKIFYDKREYARAVRKLYLESLVPLAREGLCASVYTQVSDVEDETNGILTYDRKACKLTKEDLSGIEAALQHAVRE